MTYAEIIEQLRSQNIADDQLVTLSFTVVAAEISVRNAAWLLALTDEMQSTRMQLSWSDLVQQIPDLHLEPILSAAQLKDDLHCSLQALSSVKSAPFTYDQVNYNKTGIFEATAHALTWIKLFSPEIPLALKERDIKQNPFRDPRVRIEIKLAQVTAVKNLG